MSDLPTIAVDSVNPIGAGKLPISCRDFYDEFIPVRPVHADMFLYPALVARLRWFSDHFIRLFLT
jgi:hypothetical protein